VSIDVPQKNKQIFDWRIEKSIPLKRHQLHQLNEKHSAKATGESNSNQRGIQEENRKRINSKKTQIQQ